MYREYGQVVAVTNRSLTERPFLEQIRRVCEMHPDALILREKDLSEKEYEELAKKVMAICAEYKVPCILHTFWRVAEKLKCDTVHLPLPILRQFVLEKEPIAAQADADFEIVKTKHFNISPMSPEEAILQMNLLGHNFFMFFNSDTEAMAVVYRRDDGKYGLIDAEK